MAPTEKVLTDRVHRANIGPYDQMFAITQYLINTGLQTKWKKQLTEDPDSTLLQAFNCKQHGIGRITNAFFDCPRIMVEVGYEEALQGACYIMCFKSGIMKVSSILMFLWMMGIELVAVLRGWMRIDWIWDRSGANGRERRLWNQEVWFNGLEYVDLARVILLIIIYIC